VQTAVRMPQSWIARLEVVAAALEKTGLDVSQAAVIRVALARGIAVLEAEHGIATSTATTGASETTAKGEKKPARKRAKRSK